MWSLSPGSIHLQARLARQWMKERGIIYVGVKP